MDIKDAAETPVPEMAQLLRKWVSYRTDIVHVWPGALALVNHVPVREVGNGLLLCMFVYSSVTCPMSAKIKGQTKPNLQLQRTEQWVPAREGLGGAAEDRGVGGVGTDGASICGGEHVPG